MPRLYCPSRSITPIARWAWAARAAASRASTAGPVAAAGATVLVTHDEGAVEALQPDRVLLLPDGDEDLWSPEYTELVSLA